MSMLELKNIGKSFGNNHVLKDISLSLESGEIHSIIGENGAGKSTLIKIIGGIYSLDHGKICIDGKEVHFKTPEDALKAGVGIVHQELSVVENMSVAQNVFVNREPTKLAGFIDFKKMNQMAAEEFEKIGVPIKPDAPAGTLSVGMQQIVEIVKVLSRHAKILILDEPTSALSDKEAQSLFGLLDKLRKQGTCIIFVSHKLNEIKQISDRVTVLRDGCFIGTLEREEIDENVIISMMVGRELGNLYPEKAKKRDGNVVLQTDHLSRFGKFSDVSLEFRAGEITGLFGLVGAGRTEFAWSVFGADRIDSGKVYLEGKQVKFKSPKQAIEAGVGYLSEDRKKMGLFVDMDVKDNIDVTQLKKVSTKAGMLINKKIEDMAESYISRLAIHPDDCKNQKVKSLSGGNQQKVMFAKWIEANPKLLIVDEPTRGVDVGAKTNIHAFLRELANNGMAVVMISSELPEILGLSDRVAVMSEGRLVDVLENDDLTEADVVSLAFKQEVKA